MGFTTEETGDALIWGENPGAFEMHLMRRCNNLLFEKDRRIISQRDIDIATLNDLRAFEIVNKRYGELLDRTNNAIAVNKTVGELSEIREQIDDLIETAAGAGGLALSYISNLVSLRKSLIATLSQFFSGNTKVINSLESAEAHHEDMMEKFYSHQFIAQSLAKDKSIPDDELISSLLIEEPETIRVYMSLMSQEVQMKIRQTALSILSDAIKEGAVFDNKYAILDALGC